MMNYGFNIFLYCKSIIPHFLQKLGDQLIWQTAEGLNWITAGGLFWGTATPSRHLDWVESLLRPLQTLNTSLSDFINETRYLMKLTGQVIYLEHYLNDLFDPVLRRIYIEDGSLVLPPYLYNQADNHLPVWYLYNEAEPHHTVYLYNTIEYATNGWFIVYVPAAIPLTPTFLALCRRAVNRYKQAGPTYQIQSF